MAYVARPEMSAAGVYRFLADSEEAEFRRWEDSQLRRVANGYIAEPYPRQRRLDAFAAGLPVNVATGEIWGWNAVRAGAPRVRRPSGRVPARAIVRPDDTIELNDDDWPGLFIEEHGL